MSHDNHDNHSEEKKPVAFTVPLILASVFIFIMVLVLSLCNPKHHGECECKENCSKECMEACEKGDHSKHPTDAKEEHSNSEQHKSDTHESVEKTDATASVKDSIH